jgi:APA family basic amino acid/polyamine antiporter
MDDNKNKVSSKKKEGKLRRNLTMFEATIYSVSFVIGTGIFLKPAVVLSDIGSTGSAMIIWFVGGMISLCSALSISELAAYIPKIGGLYTYVTELYGGFVGYIYGWVYQLITGPGGAAACAMAFSTFASYFIDMNLVQLRILAIASVLFCAGIQILSTKASMYMQTIGTIGKLIPIFAVVMFGLVKGDIPGAINFDLVGGSEGAGMGVALLGVLWAFDGWQATCNLGDEMVKPEKNLPRAIIVSLSFVTIVYMLFNFVIFRTADTTLIMDNIEGSIGTEVSQMLFGSAGAVLISVGMLISSFTGLNAQMISPVRNMVAMARRGQVPGSVFFRHIHPRFDTPVHSILSVVVLSIIYILTGTFNSVTNLVVFVIWVFFTLCIIGVFVLRHKRPRQANLYHVPLFPVIPIIGILGAGYLLVSTLLDSPLTAVLGVVVALVGIPMYFYCKKKYGVHENIE